MKRGNQQKEKYFYQRLRYMITKKELLQMFSDTESYNIERTESTGNIDKFCQAIGAFSNDMSGSGKMVI